MKTVKVMAMLALIGAAIGGTIATFVASGIIAWFPTPGTSVTAMCGCSTLARQVTSQLIHAQLIGGAAGALLFVVVGMIVRSSRRKKAADRATAQQS